MCYIVPIIRPMPKNIMETEDYLSRMPFTIVYIDPLHNDFQGSSRKINEYIGRIPAALPRLHQPKFAEKILADSLVKHELHYIVRNGVFCSDEKMWTFINDPDNLAVVVSQP